MEQVAAQRREIILSQNLNRRSPGKSTQCTHKESLSARINLLTSESRRTVLSALAESKPGGVWRKQTGLLLVFPAVKYSSDLCF